MGKCLGLIERSTKSNVFDPFGILEWRYTGICEQIDHNARSYFTIRNSAGKVSTIYFSYLRNLDGLRKIEQICACISFILKFQSCLKHNEKIFRFNRKIYEADVFDSICSQITVCCWKVYCHAVDSHWQQIGSYYCFSEMVMSSSWFTLTLRAYWQQVGSDFVTPKW